MSTDRWQLLSEWHNAWLLAGADERDRLRRQFGLCSTVACLLDGSAELVEVTRC